MSFKLVYEQTESYIKQSTFFFGIKSFKTNLNNQTFIISIDNLNNRGKATTLSCFDLYTLYLATAIIHDKFSYFVHE